MARFSLAPGFVKLFYARGAVQHVMTLCVKYDGTPTPGSMPTVFQRDNVVTAVSTPIGAFVDEMLPCFGTDTSFTHYECWYKPSVDSDPLYIYTGLLASKTGTAAGTGKVAGELVCVLRSIAGHIMKVYMMESGLTNSEVFNPPTYGGSVVADVFAYLLSDSNIFIARDGSYPVAGVRALGKTNDALRKRLILNS